MKKHHIYIVLTRTSTAISKLIQIFKNDKYTHAAISLDKELDNMYSFGRKYTYNPFIGRFNQESLDTGVYGLHANLPGLIMEIEVSKQQYDSAKMLINEFISNSNLYKYNYVGLLHGLFGSEGCYDRRFLCSEFVYYILNESGIVDLEIPRNLVRPQSLLNIRSRIVYEGNLKEVEFINSNYNLKEIIIMNLVKSKIEYKNAN